MGLERYGEGVGLGLRIRIGVIVAGGRSGRKGRGAGRYFECDISRSRNEENNSASWFLVLLELINVNITFGISNSQLTKYW